MAGKKFANFTLQDIPELQRGYVHMKDSKEVERKIRTLIEDGLNRLQIVSDFDHTMTKQRLDNGKKLLTSFSIMQNCPSYPETKKIEAQRLFDKYRPYELDETLTKAEKTKYMVEWWNAEGMLIRGFKLPRSEFLDQVKDSAEVLRDGTLDMLKYLNKENVPVLIFSAGLGDSIVAVLNVNNVFFSNVKVVSNFLNYLEGEIVHGTIPPTIHILNKNEQCLKDSEYFDLIRDRQNVILMGDVIGDAGMSDGVPHNTVLKIGFLYENANKLMPAFKEHFDIILEDDQTMNIPMAIMKLIGGSSS